MGRTRFSASRYEPGAICSLEEPLQEADVSMPWPTSARWRRWGLAGTVVAMVLVAAPKASAAANGWATAGPGGATIGSVAGGSLKSRVGLGGTDGRQGVQKVGRGAT